MKKLLISITACVLALSIFSIDAGRGRCCKKRVRCAKRCVKPCRKRCAKRCCKPICCPKPCLKKICASTRIEQQCPDVACRTVEKTVTVPTVGFKEIMVQDEEYIEETRCKEVIIPVKRTVCYKVPRKIMVNRPKLVPVVGCVKKTVCATTEECTPGCVREKCVTRCTKQIPPCPCP